MKSIFIIVFLIAVFVLSGCQGNMGKTEIGQKKSIINNQNSNQKSGERLEIENQPSIIGGNRKEQKETENVQITELEEKEDFLDFSLIPDLEYLGNDLKRTDLFKNNNEDYKICPIDENAFYNTKDPMNDGKYFISVQKCRSEKEALDFYEKRTYSHIFSPTDPVYGEESVYSGHEEKFSRTETIKFRIGIYYVDVLGRNKGCRLEVVEDLAQKMADYLAGHL